MIDWLIFGIIWLFTVGQLWRRKPQRAVVIGVPDAETKKMFWLSKKEKTRWDEFKESVPPFLWGYFLGALTVGLIVIINLG